MFAIFSLKLFARLAIFFAILTCSSNGNDKMGNMFSYWTPNELEIAGAKAELKRDREGALKAIKNWPWQSLVPLLLLIPIEQRANVRFVSESLARASQDIKAWTDVDQVKASLATNDQTAYRSAPETDATRSNCMR